MLREFAKVEPCPFCGCREIAIEQAIQYGDTEPGQYLLKCTGCGASTELARSKQDAIYNWEFEQWSYTTMMLNANEYTHDPDAWNELNNAIVIQAFRDLKAEVKRNEHVVVSTKEKDWFLSDELKYFTTTAGVTYVRAAEVQVKYDDWRFRKGCRYCKRSCPHKDQYRWRIYKQGKALCMKEVYDGSGAGSAKKAREHSASTITGRG